MNILRRCEKILSVEHLVWEKMKNFSKSSETPHIGVFSKAREILYNFGPRGGGTWSKNIFCGKFDETSFCTSFKLISVLLQKLEPFLCFAHTNGLTLRNFGAGTNFEAL